MGGEHRGTTSRHAPTAREPIAWGQGHSRQWSVYCLDQPLSLPDMVASQLIFHCLTPSKWAFSRFGLKMMAIFMQALIFGSAINKRALFPLVSSLCAVVTSVGERYHSHGRHVTKASLPLMGTEGAGIDGGAGRKGQVTPLKNMA